MADAGAPGFPNFCSLLMAHLLLRCTAAPNSWQLTPTSACHPPTGVTARTKRSDGTGTRETRTGAGWQAQSPGAWGDAALMWVCAGTGGLCRHQRFVPAPGVCRGVGGTCLGCCSGSVPSPSPIFGCHEPSCSPRAGSAPGHPAARHRTPPGTSGATALPRCPAPTAWTPCPSLPSPRRMKALALRPPSRRDPSLCWETPRQGPVAW